MSLEIINQTIDKNNRLKEIKTIDYIDNNRLGITTKIQTMLSDTTLDEPFIAYAQKHMAESQLINIAEYCQRKASVHKGRAFVKICSNVIAKQGSPR